MPRDTAMSIPHINVTELTDIKKKKKHQLAAAESATEILFLAKM